MHINYGVGGMIDIYRSWLGMVMESVETNEKSGFILADKEGAWMWNICLSLVLVFVENSIFAGYTMGNYSK